jgi:hypothetical protein
MRQAERGLETQSRFNHGIVDEAVFRSDEEKDTYRVEVL